MIDEGPLHLSEKDKRDLDEIIRTHLPKNLLIDDDNEEFENFIAEPETFANLLDDDSEDY